MESTRLHRLKRIPDGVLGVGFLQTDSGRPILCAAWPTGEPKKYEAQSAEELAGYGVEVVDDESFAQSSELDQTIGLLTQENERLKSQLSDANSRVIELDDLLVNLKAQLGASNQPLPPTPQPAPIDQGGSQSSTDGTIAIDEDAAIEAYLKEHGLDVTNRSVIEALKGQGVTIQSAQVTAAKERLKAAA